MPSIAPLKTAGKPGDSDWMELEWTAREPLAAENTRKVPAGAGLYLLADAGSQEIVFIGQSADIAKRLLDHSRKTWDEKVPPVLIPDPWTINTPAQPPGAGDDLIGNYFEHFRKAPEYQYRNTTGH